MNYLLSNNVYIYQSWTDVGTMGVNSRKGVISAIYKKDDKEDIENYRPISLILDAIIFLFLNISYITLHNRHFHNLKTNQLI